jgi:hypothetical protein
MEFPDMRAVLDYKNVEAYLAKQVPKASWGAVILNLALMIIIGGIANIIAVLLRPMVSSLVPSIAGISLAAASGNMSIGMTIMVLAAGFIGFFILGGIMHLLAKAFGGTGRMVQLLYLMSVAGLAVLPISVVLVLLTIIPCVSCISGICSLAIAAYLYYLYYLMIKMVYGLDSGKAILTLVAYFAVIIIISVILGVILIALSALSVAGASELR